jgi:phenylalanyl-tRNA synthetase beta chain
MLISKKWLNKYIDVSDITDDQMDKMMSLSGTSIESIENPWEGIEKVVVGRIEEIEKHPNADKLIVCKVNFGEYQKTIVTGDTSLAVGDIVPVALVGAVLKDNFKIKKSKLRGVESEGMMCSLQEIKLEDHSTGVYKFREKVEIGKDVVEYFNLNDSVYDFEVTSNRPDELGYLGIVKEIEALTGKKKTRKKIKTDYSKTEKKTSDFISVEIENPEACNRYTTLLVSDVEVKESPVWLKRDLISMGLRPINNIVDITNYILMETGHPVHAFDYDDLTTKKIVVRTAKKGEKLLLLNEEEIEFCNDELLITDGEKPLALAGIMGGEHSGVTNKTKNVLLEVAYFNPVKIRKTARSLNISSDSSYRFERGVDPNDAEFVIARLAVLIEELAGGKPSAELLDAYPNQVKEKQVLLRKDRVESLLGIPYDDSDIETALTSLGFKLLHHQENKTWDVIVPTFRPDVAREVDLIEEIGRIVGYDKIPAQIPYLNGYNPARDEYQNFRYKLRDLILSSGYSEIIPLSLIDPKDIRKVLKDEEAVWNKNQIEVLKPLSQDISVLRPSLLITLLKTIGYNNSHQQNDLKLFENGVSIIGGKDGKYVERETFSFAATGKMDHYDYQSKLKNDFYNFKGTIEEILNHLDIDEEKIVFDRIEENSIYDQFMYKGQSALIFIDDQQIGIFGLIKREVLDEFGVNDYTYWCELDLKETYYSSKENSRNWKSVLGTNFPSSKKDFSVLVGKGVEIGHVIKKIRSSKQVENVFISDVYTGKNIAKGHNSITISVIFRSSDHTLTQKELEKCINNVVKILKNENMDLREG